MAVDPHAVCQATKTAVKVATNEDIRKKFLAIILTPIIIIVLLVCCIQYILDTPMMTLEGIFGNGASDEMYILNFKTNMAITIKPFQKLMQNILV